MNHLPTLFRLVLLAACLCLAASPSAQIVRAHVPETIALTSSIRPETLSAGSFHACAIQTDGTLACWGDDTYDQATPHPGPSPRLPPAKPIPAD